MKTALATLIAAVALFVFSVGRSDVFANDFIKVPLPFWYGAITLEYFYPHLHKGDKIFNQIPFFLEMVPLIRINGVNFATSNVDIKNAKNVYFLIVASDVYLSYQNQKMGELILGFSDGSSYKIDLIAGQNIREVEQSEAYFKTVNSVTDPNSTEVYRELFINNKPSVLDMLKVPIPQNLQRVSLKSITYVGGFSTVYINPVATTVETGDLPPVEPFLDLPWDYQAKGLSFSDAALEINSYFDHTYPVLSSGVIEPNGKLNQVTTYEGELSMSKAYSAHDGYDYGKTAGVNIGEPVLAAGNGCATYSFSYAGGNMIFIDHGNGYQTRYLHMNDDENLITKSADNCVNVAKGQEIGTIWFSGHVLPPGADGAHIHFMVVEDKNKDGNFQDNIPDGVTDPFGWQSEDADPWPSFAFNYAGRDRTGNKSYYLWEKPIPNLLNSLSANGGFFQLERYNLNFPQGATTQNLNLEMQYGPSVKTNNNLASIGSTLTINAKDIFGQIIHELVKPYTVKIDFSTFDLSKFNTGTISVYSSEDGTNWQKEDTNVDLENRTASSQINHMSYFALMAEKLDTQPPTTMASLKGNNRENWFRSDVKITLDAQDNSGGLGVDYTLYNINGGEWQKYTDPFVLSSEGQYTIEFYSLDKDENAEDHKTETFYIDKTPPEAKILIDKNGQDLIVEAQDTNTTTITPIERKNTQISYYLSDLAGNITRLDVRDFDKSKRDKFRIYSITYKQNPPITLPANLYKVIYSGKPNNTFPKEELFSIKNEVKIKISYDKKKDKSTIYTLQENKLKQKEIRNGLALLQLQTNQGNLEYSY